MLPTPATTREFMTKALTETRRPRARRQSALPVKSADSGSTASAARSLWRAGSRVVNSRQPKRRGSLNRRQRPESSTRSTWSCASGGEAASRMRRLPDMPRCRISVPASVSISRYLARRATARMRAPASLAGRLRGTRQRRRGSRTTSLSTRRPTSQGSMPWRVVSTSGSSGILPCDPASEPGSERHADNARLVVEARQVVEVDGALDVLLVRDVPAEERGLPLAAVVRVADARAALEVAVGLELLRLVDEEVRLALEGPVCVEENLAVADRDTVARCDRRDVLGRLHERVAVDDRPAVGVEGVEHRARPGAAGRHDERGIVDLGVCIAQAQRNDEAVGYEERTV